VTSVVLKSPVAARVWIVALYGAASYAFCSPLFAQPSALGVYDWDQHLFYYGSVLKSIVEYGQLPFWNPWYCGGNVLWQNPQIALLSPAYPLTALMPLALAMKINVLLHYWAGFIGMHLLLTRIIGLRSWPIVFFLATMFTASGAPAIHFLVGHSVFLPAFYLPFLLYFFLRSIQTGALHGALLGGVVLALMVYNGGTHILPMAIAAIVMLSAMAAAMRRHWRPLILGAVCCVAGLAYSAPKLLPVVSFVNGDQFWDTRPPIERPDRTTLEMAARSYLDPYQMSRAKFPEQRHGWHEYGNYIGEFAALLILAGVLWTFGARGAPDYWMGLALAVTTIVFFVWSLGEFSRFAPASLAAHLPLFSSFRIPSRYSIAFVLCAAATVGWAARALALDTAPSARARVFIALVCLAASAHLIARNRTLLTNVFSEPPLAAGFKPMRGPTVLQTDAESNAYRGGSPMFTALMNDRSFYYCYESLQLRHTADAEHPVVFTDGTATLGETVFTPNRIEFTVVGGSAPSRVTLNQNFAPGWRSTAGAFTHVPGGALPGVTLAPGQTGRFAFVFVPEGLWLGVGVFAAAVGLSAFALRRHSSTDDTDDTD
jgi:hypothetical protein